MFCTAASPVTMVDTESPIDFSLAIKRVNPDRRFWRGNQGWRGRGRRGAGGRSVGSGRGRCKEMQIRQGAHPPARFGESGAMLSRCVGVSARGPFSCILRRWCELQREPREQRRRSTVAEPRGGRWDWKNK